MYGWNWRKKARCHFPRREEDRMVERDKLSVSGWREILPNVYEREGDHKEEDSQEME